jgi:hypothetical protein
MGIQRENGYSASLSAYFRFNGHSVRLAKTNGCTFVIAEPAQVAAGTQGELVVIVDGREHSRLVSLPGGIGPGDTTVQYKEIAPF